MSKIAVVTVPFILTYAHQVFMQQTVVSLLSCKTTHELDLIAICNEYRGDDDALARVESTFDYFEKNDANNLSRAWNRGILKGFERGADYCLVTNLDVIFHESYLDRIVTFADSNPSAVLWSGCEWPDSKTLQSAPLDSNLEAGSFFCCFLIDRRLFDIVGYFDEDFSPAYFEDSDMAYRIQLAGLSIARTSSALIYHHERTTINQLQAEGCERDIEIIAAALDRNGKRYLNKWGGTPGRETYTKAYQGTKQQ